MPGDLTGQIVPHPDDDRRFATISIRTFCHPSSRSFNLSVALDRSGMLRKSANRHE
jgi:hypothetical protein